MKRWSLALSILAAACTAEGSGTGGRSVIFDVAVQPPEYMIDGAEFTTANEWHVELDEAVIAIGPVYLWEEGGVSALESDDEPDLVSMVSELVLPTAHAHPGDVWFDGGTLRGEYLEQVAFDLVGGDAGVLGTARGIAGEVRSLTIVLDPPTAGTLGSASELRGHHAWVSGTARRGRQVVAFEGGLEIPAEGVQRQVDGVPIEGELDDDGTLVLGVNPKAWFDQANFETLDVPNEAGDRMVITPDSQVGKAWYVGARTSAAFSCRWTTDERFAQWEGAQ